MPLPVWCDERAGSCLLFLFFVCRLRRDIYARFISSVVAGRVTLRGSLKFRLDMAGREPQD